MPFKDHWQYEKTRASMGGSLPEFSDFNDPRYSSTQNRQKMGIMMWWQWIHCVGNWGEDHSMCKKTRWYLEKFMPEYWLEKWEERKALGHYDEVLLYGIKPFKEFVPLYQPVKKNRKGAYEFWLDRNFEPLIAEDAANWKEKAPILGDIYIKGKKPVAE